MQPDTPAIRIQKWQRRWKQQAWLHNCMLATGGALLTGTLLHVLFQASWWWFIPLFIACLLLSLLVYPQWRLQQSDVIQYLNRHLPALEESAHLLVKPTGTLHTLEQLQWQRIQQVLLQQKPVSPLALLLKKAVAYLTGLAILSLAVLVWAGKHPQPLPKPAITVHPTPAPPTEKLLPGIDKAIIQIEPPEYTQKIIRSQAQLNVQVEEGAYLTWHVHTSLPVKRLQLLFNDSTTLSLDPIDSSRQQWQASTTIRKAGFYQVQLDEHLSEYYKIETIKDKAPVITMQSPALHTVIDFGMPQQVPVQVHVSDDYGIQNSTIVATIASGNGEAVKFKEHQLSFHNDFTTKDTGYQLQQTIDLHAMQMVPGDELYFYIKATDTHQQESRSDMYIITLPDTAQLMNLDGMVSSVAVKPEYFRSQRQIIIETELLLRSQQAISQQDFTKKSEDLGVDQKLLRLRYGKFLGEESETHIGDDRIEDGDEHHDNDHHHEAGNDAKDFNNADKIIDAFSHKHDIAEDATFFDPETKKQLKAVLAEMWNAELKLRTHLPQEALPFEYKALRLLKDLQQKSRSYVGKTSAKIPPLKPEKRLTGELDKIGSPSTQKQASEPADKNNLLRSAIGTLEQLKAQGTLSGSGIEIIQQATQHLGAAASAQPSAYLTAYEATQRIVKALRQQQKVSSADIATTEKAIRKLLPAPGAMPSAPATNGIPGLSQQYFQQLKTQQRP
ncbi:protein of unknown function [Filimonas lacunae]|uniref:DUF4175 domain-containing protein n=1 Tax=Filimonas lacunae TaxID=477680 RepID=A0A173MPA8_9BACT|nr:DUF4175 family protein [Filimonas lacunae]BAV09503.1 hypothetical protein FLA_5552 [Filimonas lacunae]SIS74329.1 protein of unknown function [Filimonas lacunae]